jgi:hypothetical protein
LSLLVLSVASSPVGAISAGSPTVAALFGVGYSYSPNGPGCSVVALTNWWVVSSNHCYDHALDPGGASSYAVAPGSGWRVKFGGTRQLSGGTFVDTPAQDIEIAEVHRYPGNQTGRTQRVDLILFRLRTPFVAAGRDDDWQQLLWAGTSQQLLGRPITCFGWGGGSSMLRYASFSVGNVTMQSRFAGSDGIVFRGDHVDYAPSAAGVSTEDGDSGSGCFTGIGGGRQALVSITVAQNAGVSVATTTPRNFDGSARRDVFGEETGVREWLDSVMFASIPNAGWAGEVESAPAIASEGREHLAAFWVDPAGHLRRAQYARRWQPGSDDLGAPSNMTLTLDAPGAVSWGPGRMDVFARGADKQLHQYCFPGICGPGWIPLALPNAPATLESGIAVSSWAANRLDLFALGPQRSIYHVWFDGRWGEWEDLGGVGVGRPAAVSWGPGRIDVFVLGSDSAIHHKWYERGWSPWGRISGPMAGPPAVSSYRAGRLDVFARGTNGKLKHRWYEAGTWVSDWIDTGIAAPEHMSAVSWGPGRIDIVARNPSGGISHVQYQR